MTSDAEVPAGTAPIPEDSTPPGIGAGPYGHPAFWPTPYGVGVGAVGDLEPDPDPDPDPDPEPDPDPDPEPDDPEPTYLAMFEEYAAGQSWIGAAEAPLVFHLKRLCQQLDSDAAAPAAVSSAYLQAFSRLDRRRPGATQPPRDPEQTSIFDFVED